MASSGPEAKIVAAVVRMLEKRGALVVNIHGSVYSRAGTPDLVGVLPGGVAFCLEVKTPDGVASKLQERAIRRWSERGARAAVVRSVEDAERVCFGDERLEES